MVVTGASGFIGRALMASLAGAGADAIGISRRDVPGLLRVRDYSEAPSGDVLVHLGEAADRGWVAANSGRYEQIAASTITKLVARGYGRIVYASSATLYGDRSTAAHDVGDPLEITDAYARVKRNGELAVLACGGVVVRIANLYGPGMSRNTVVGTIVSQLARVGPLLVRDAGPVRDFLWVDDAATALAAVSLGRVGGVFNIGTGVGTSVFEFARLVLHACGQSSRPVVASMPSPLESHLVVDPHRTAMAFGWVAQTSVEQGARRLAKDQTIRH